MKRTSKLNYWDICKCIYFYFMYIQLFARRPYAMEISVVSLIDTYAYSSIFTYYLLYSFIQKNEESTKKGSSLFVYLSVLFHLFHCLGSVIRVN